MTEAIFHGPFMETCGQDGSIMFQLIDKQVHKVMNSLSLIHHIALDRTCFHQVKWLFMTLFIGYLYI
jgi:hypothetical protein